MSHKYFSYHLYRKSLEKSSLIFIKKLFLGLYTYYEVSAFLLTLRETAGAYFSYVYCSLEYTLYLRELLFSIPWNGRNEADLSVLK